jgi:L-alanine-DL-glutamate epimerase-like enolase superfamily enzyme
VPRIADVEVLVLRASDYDPAAIDNVHEAAVVRVTSDDGVTGYGEAGAPPRAVKALVDEPASWAWDWSIRDLLVGEDPSDPRALWRKLYDGRWWSGRAGIGHVALGGIDMALWDLAGKLAGVPVWRVLGQKREASITPYITLYHGPSPLETTIERQVGLLDEARRRGFRAAKVEALVDTAADDGEIVELVRRVREHVGPDFILLCDVGYRWRGAEQAIRCVRELDRFDLFLLEAPLFPDDLAGYRRLAAEVRTPIAGAEILTSHAEFVALIDSGDVAIVQPGTNRLGITETDRLARSARDRGRQLVTYGWVATTFAMMANIHVAAVNDNVPLVEYAPPAFYPDAVLRRDLAGPEPTVVDGAFAIDDAPGLGVELDEGALERLQA